MSWWPWPERLSPLAPFLEGLCGGQWPVSECGAASPADCLKCRGPLLCEELLCAHTLQFLAGAKPSCRAQQGSDAGFARSAQSISFLRKKKKSVFLSPRRETFRFYSQLRSLFSISRNTAEDRFDQKGDGRGGTSEMQQRKSALFPHYHKGKCK